MYTPSSESAQTNINISINNINRTQFQATGAMNIALKIFVCPSRRKPTFLSANGGTNYGNVSGICSDYAANYGTTTNATSNDGPFWLNDALHYGVGQRFAEISDGLSPTIVMGEKHVMLPSFKLQPATLDESDFCVYAGRAAFSVGRIGGPSAPFALTQNDSYRNQFGSWHPGIVPILFGDGSTQTLRNSMSTTTLGALCGSHDGFSPGDYQ
jgi:hypothetical protein